MTIQPTHPARHFTRSVSGPIGVASLFAGLILAGQSVMAQTVLDTPSLPSQGDPSPAARTAFDPIGLRQVVKIIVEPGTNRMLLVGSQEDLAVVLRTLESIQRSLNAAADPTVTEKVVLQSQLADTVASIMSRSMVVHRPGGPEVKINAVHFPEAILLSGPASAVKRAKQLLATIDRYDGLSDTGVPAQKQSD